MLIPCRHVLRHTGMLLSSQSDTEMTRYMHDLKAAYAMVKVLKSVCELLRVDVIEVHEHNMVSCLCKHYYVNAHTTNLIYSTLGIYTLEHSVHGITICLSVYIYTLYISMSVY